MEALNLEFRAICKAMGWSQADAARKLEMTTGGVSQIWHGQTHPTPRTMKILRTEAQKEKPELFGFRGEGDGMTFGLVKEPSAPFGSHAEIARELEDLDEPDRELLRILIKRLQTGRNKT